jgi:hypothetical protein
LEELNDKNLPSDGKLDKTIDEVERKIINYKLSLFIYLFIALLCFSTLVSLYFKTWFAPFTGKSLFLISKFIGIGNLGLASIHLKYVPSYGLPIFIFNFVFIILLDIAFSILDLYNFEFNTSYRSLFIASFSDDESNSGKITAPKENFFTNFKVILHFFYIIASGFILGNVLYVPLFSLQKNYSSEFGFLLFAMLIFVCFFYVLNYYRIGKEKEFANVQDILVSISFLQFRFLRNIFYFLVSTFAVVLFITVLFSLLTYNLSILRDVNIIEKTINL